MSPAGGHQTINPRIRERRESVERSRSQKRLRLAALALGLVALAAMGVGLLYTPWFEATVVKVTGAHPNTPDRTIMKAAGLLRHPALISVDPGPTSSRIELLPFIASAQVTRHWPDAVTIRVTERVPVMAMSGPAASWSTLDGNGRTLAVNPGRPGLPVLVVHGPAGPVPPAPVGATVAAWAGPGLTVARTLPPAFAGQVVSITVAADGTASLALNSHLVVLLGTVSNLTAKYEDVAAIIAHASLRGAHTIDVTVPQSPTVGS